MFNKYPAIHDNVVAWAEERNIFSKATPQRQVDKTVEEVMELKEAVDNNNLAGIIDGIGDVLVTLIILSKMKGLSIDECLLVAYDEIKERTGKMVDGQFVKDIPKYSLGSNPIN